MYIFNLFLYTLWDISEDVYIFYNNVNVFFIEGTSYNT